MICVDEEALICDFAETYHIYDYRSLPLKLAGIFACGLRENSRIMMKISGLKISLNDMMLAAIADNTSLTAWLQTRDGARGINRPKSIIQSITGERKDNITTFRSGEEFDKKWKELTGGEK